MSELAIDTIMAPGTPRGESAIGVIRLSGPGCPTLAEAIFGKKVVEAGYRRAQYGQYRNLENTVLDAVVYILFAEGSSYTGEWMLEIHTHGNPFIQQRVLDDLSTRGARTAEPGEFTRRAFLNGKMDLSQAEAVSQMIRARSDRALEAARRQLGGNLGRRIETWIESLLRVTAALEAYIDFPEEDLPPEDEAGPLASLRELSGGISSLMATQEYSTLLHEGVKTVILGEPNTGKSSLLNSLTGESRAIVSAEPGTTRDYVEERLYIGSWLLRVVDTAGIHETAHAIEQEGIARTRAQIEEADILLLVCDRSRPRPTLPAEVLSKLTPNNTLIVENKCDLPPHAQSDPWIPDIPHVSISATRGDGIEDLRNAVLGILEEGLEIPEETAVLISSRHAEALQEAKDSVEQARQLLLSGEASELAASELHLAMEAMGRITGRVDNEAMLDQLFANFCIGK